MTARKIPYINKFDGTVVVLTKQAAKRLSEDWDEVKFTKNKDGVDVMRLQLANATVDIFESEEATENVNSDTK